MSLFIADRGRQKPKLVKLTTTNATTIIDGPSVGTITLESLHWSVKGTNTDLSIWITDGTTSCYYMDTETKTARTHDTIMNWHVQLLSGWSLKAQASVVDQIDLVAVVAMSTSQDVPR